MDKLIEKYYNEVAVKSTFAIIIWKGGVIANTIAYIIFVFYYQKNWYIIWYFAIMILLLVVSYSIFIKKLQRILKLKLHLSNAFK